MLVILHVLAIFLLVGLGFFVFVSDPRKRANQTFAAFIAFLAIWTVKDLTFWNFYARDAAAGWWVSASFTIALLMQYALAVFAWVFPENSRTPKHKAAVIFAPALILVPATLFGLLWKNAGLNDGVLTIEFTPLAYAFVIYVYAIFFYGTYTLFQKYLKYRGTQPGQQLGAILWALAITLVLSTTANIAFPLFGNMSLLPLNALLLMPGVLIYAYAILNFKLFSLQTALDQFRLFPITYKVAVTIAAVAVSSFVLFQIPITYWAFRNGMDDESWRRYIVFSVISALAPNLVLLLLILRSISRPLQKITIAAYKVSRGEYGTEADVRVSNDEIGVLAVAFNKMSTKMAADISELQRLNEHLIKTEKLATAGTLAAGVAHEINNPLASVSSIVQMMRDENGHSPETMERLRLISDQIERIKNITSGLNVLSSQRAAKYQPTDLRSVIEGSLEIASLDPLFAQLQIETLFPNRRAMVIADADQLHQVLINLLLNARDAMPDGGTVFIDLEIDRNDAVVTISDEGPGIDPTIANSIFDPFFTTKPPGQGTGLGLSVAQGIIDAIGGTIEVGGREPNGAVFTIKLPIARNSHEISAIV